MKKLLYLFIMAVTLAAAYYAYSIYNKPHRNVANEKASFVLTAAGLFNEFNTDSNVALKKYLDKTVEIDGKVQEVVQINDEANEKTSIYLSTGSEENIVKVTLLQKNNEVKAGDSLSCKGILTGFLTTDFTKDVIISNAVMQKKY